MIKKNSKNDFWALKFEILRTMIQLTSFKNQTNDKINTIRTVHAPMSLYKFNKFMKFKQSPFGSDMFILFKY